MTETIITSNPPAGGANSTKIANAFAGCRAAINQVSTAGYTLMVNFSIMGYEHFECSFHEKWKEEYDGGNYFLHDPVFQWALLNEGAIRWSEVALPDPVEILEKSKRYGLAFGAAFSYQTGSKRSMVFLSRHDREVTSDEMQGLNAAVTSFFNSLLPPPSLSAKELEMLRLHVQKELTYEQIANHVGLSLSAVKSSFLRMRQKFGCKSTARLGYLAKERNLFGVEPPLPG
ncbi:autoinducer binding domain-containing protein [Cribrihabitans pelagius]|uniref:autoinducer binding domain-containing protein n=1 Tax=Cribrihabitans pelagius TaxID=1765746 RepID=UPI003B5C560C